MKRQWRLVAVSVVLVVAVAIVGLFVLDVETSDPEPALFDDTVSMGLALEDERGLEEEVELPKAQVFYSQYEYVVGYYGLETFVTAQRSEGHTQQFGYPLTIYVSDYSATDIELNADGYPTVDNQPAWHDAEDAWYVSESDAVAPGGDTVMPFSDREDAHAFAETHDGIVLTWDELLEPSSRLTRQQRYGIESTTSTARGTSESRLQRPSATGPSRPSSVRTPTPSRKLSRKRQRTRLCSFPTANTRSASRLIGR